MKNMFRISMIIFLLVFTVGCMVSSDAYLDEGSNEVILNENAYAELLNYRDALEIFGEGVYAVVYDIQTGISFDVRRAIGGFNSLADVETLTLYDTEKLLYTAGGYFNIRRRPVIVIVGDRRIAASISPFEHKGREDLPFGDIVDNRSGSTGTGINLNSIQDNGMVGVVDIFFWGSFIPGVNRVDERHQENVLRAHNHEGR